MALDLNRIAESIAGTVIAGILLAVGIRLVQRIKRTVNLPLKVSFDPEPTYASDLGVFASVPSRKIVTELTDSVIRRILTAEGSAYLCPTPFVIRLTNTSNSKDSRDIYLREITIDIKEYWPLQRALHGMSLLQATTIQAGGRGSEGHFAVVFRSTDRIRIPLIQSTATENKVSSRGMRIRSGAYGEVNLTFLPVISGKYMFDLYIETDEGGYKRKTQIARDIAIVECQDFDWVEEAISTFNWTDPRKLEPGAKKQFLRRLTEVRKGEHARFPEPLLDRRVKIYGSIDTEAWG